MAQFGSNGGMLAQNLSQVLDDQGNPIIASTTGFGDSPAGQALLTQQLFGLSNATFNLTPPSVGDIISYQNPVPYWDFQDYSNNVMSGSAIYNDTAQTWGILINPGTAVAGDYCTFTTRSYLVNDDNLGLRQKAFAVLSKTGTAAGTTQWNLTLNSIYYDASGSALGTATIGTALDTGTWTSLSGYTTTGGTAINAAARYVDIQFKLTATATVTGSAAVTIKSCLLSSKIGANSSFLVTETFTSSATWLPPTGVTSLYAAVVVGAGGGGAGGSLRANSIAGTVAGSGGGGGGRWSAIYNLDLTGVSSVAIGIGAGGAGGAGATATKTNGSSTNYLTAGSNGAAGGATTFGAYLSVPGGSGGTAGTAGAPAGGAAAAAATVTIYGGDTLAGGAGGAGASAAVGGSGVASAASTYSQLPSTPPASAGAAGTAGTITGGDSGSGTALGGAASSASWLGGGGASGGVVTATGAGATTYYAGGAGGAGGGGGGGGPAGLRFTNINQTVSATGGVGGAGASGGGGGGGGGVGVCADAQARYNNNAWTITGGTGGAGASGIVYIVYVA